MGKGSQDELLAKFRSGADAFQSLLEELVTGMEKEKQELISSLEREREELQKSWNELNRERQQFEEESKRVHHVMSESQPVILNVGGHRYTTTVTTLQNAPAPSLFNAMFSGRHPIKTDEQGCVFVDRDGRHFADILNFLRDGHFNYPPDGKDYKYLLELRAEAGYYGLCGLVSLIDRFPYGVVKAQRAASINAEDSWMYEDGRDEVVFTVDRPCQLLGVGLCGTEGGYNVECELYEVDPGDFSTELACLQDTAQSFTKADGQLVKLFWSAPATLFPDKMYMVSAAIRGSESFCCEDCLDTTIAAGVRIQFQCWESPNGTNEQRGQFPEFYIRAMSP